MSDGQWIVFHGMYQSFNTTRDGDNIFYFLRVAGNHDFSDSPNSEYKFIFDNMFYTDGTYLKNE